MFITGCAQRWIVLIPAMAPSNTSPAGSPTPSRASLPTSQARRPLQREGAIILLSPAEQALEDAMLRSSPPPDQMLGKRTRTNEQSDGQEGDTEPEEGTSATAQAQSLAPSLGNVTAATLRYATNKKLRAEQRDELEAFLHVSTSLMHFGPCLTVGQETALGRQAKLFVCLLSVENKIDAFRSAAPPYQVSDELKV